MKKDRKVYIVLRPNGNPLRAYGTGAIGWATMRIAIDETRWVAPFDDYSRPQRWAALLVKGWRIKAVRF